MQYDYNHVLRELLNLLDGYNNTFRKSTINHKINDYKRLTGTTDAIISVDDKAIRENLIEHIGSLPIIATFLYPYLEKKFDLGKTLTILAIHDIGETVVGDVLFYNKTQEDDDKEAEAALKLLPKVYHELYKEFEEPNSDEARFAKSVDKLAPDLLESFNPPEISKRRFNKQGFSLDSIVDKKLEFHKWSPFLEGLFKANIDKLTKRLQ